jgi:hypothetical protein
MNALKLFKKRRKPITVEERKLAVYEMLINYSEFDMDFAYKLKSAKSKHYKKDEILILTPELNAKTGWLFRHLDIENKDVCPYPFPEKKSQLYIGTKKNNDLLEFANFKYCKIMGKRKSRPNSEPVVRLKRDVDTLKKLIVLFHEGNTIEVKREIKKLDTIDELDEMDKWGMPFPGSDYYRDNENIIEELIKEMNFIIKKISQYNEELDIYNIVLNPDCDLLTYGLLYLYCKDRQRFIDAFSSALNTAEHLYDTHNRKELIEITLKSIIIGNHFNY